MQVKGLAKERKHTFCSHLLQLLKNFKRHYQAYSALARKREKTKKYPQTGSLDQATPHGIMRSTYRPPSRRLQRQQSHSEASTELVIRHYFSAGLNIYPPKSIPCTFPSLPLFASLIFSPRMPFVFPDDFSFAARVSMCVSCAIFY